MKKPFPSILTCLVIVASTLVWIAGVSVGLVYLLGLSESVGWWVAGSLGFSSMVAIAVIHYEMMHAVEIDAAEGGGGIEDPGGRVPWTLPNMGPKWFSKV